MNITLKERDGSPAPNITKRERGGDLAGDSGADHDVPDAAAGTTKWAPYYISSYAQGFDDIDRQLGTKALECKLCGAKHNIRINYCHACMSSFGTSRDDKEGFKRLIAEVPRRFGFKWKFTTRGFVSKARQETKRALKHGKVARREGFFCVIDRLTRDDVYRNRVVGNSASRPWWSGTRCSLNEKPLRFQCTLPYDVRKREYALRESRSTQIGGSDTAPHAQNYKKTSQDDDDDVPDDLQEDDPALAGWSWTQSFSWWTPPPPPPNRSAGGDPSESGAEW